MKQNQSILLPGCILIALCAWALPALAQEAEPKAAAEQPAVAGPDTLFLTWFGDPTTSIVAQWLEEGVASPLVEGATDAIPAFDAPKLDDVTIDGRADDWEGRGLSAGYLAGNDGRIYEGDDLNARAKIGWDERGLVAIVRVRDNVSTESDDPGTLWSADSIEFFVSTGVGSDQRYQVLVAPGVTRPTEISDNAEAQAAAVEAKPRHWQYDYRRDRSGGEIGFEYATTATDSGYIVEVRLPWANLGVDPAAGERVGFQFYVNDKDGEEDVKTIWWHPDNDANERPESMHALQLTDAAGEGAAARAKVMRDGDQALLVVWAEAGMGGQKVKAICAGEVLGESTFYEKRGSSKAKIELKASPEGSRWGTIDAEVDGERVAYAKPLRWMSVSRPEALEVSCSNLIDDDHNQRTATKIVPFGVYSGLFLHRVEYQGLEPGTEYALRIHTQDGATTHRFRTAPATLDEPLVFATGGDVGTSEHVGQLHREAAKWSPAFGLVGGDCAYANGRTPQRWVEYLQIWRENMVDPEGRLIPMLCAIGNHEVDGGWGQTRERAPLFLAMFDGLFPEHTYTVIDFGDYMSLVMLDSGHLCAHDGEQADWLEETLASRADRDHLLTIYHVPAYPSHRDFDGQHSAQAREHWVPLFDKYGVDVSFENHDHTYKRTHHLTGGEPDPHGVLYLGDGCWGRTPRTVASPEDRPYLKKSRSSRHVIRVVLDGKSKRFMAVDEKGRTIDRYHLD